MAAYTATTRLEQLVQQPFGSLSMALSTYAGQNVGAAFFSLLNSVEEIAGRVGLPLLLVRVFFPDFWGRFEAVFGLHRLMANPPSAEVWHIWITAGLTWVLAGSFCTLRYLSWKKKAGRSRTARAASGGPA